MTDRGRSGSLRNATHFWALATGGVLGAFYFSPAWGLPRAFICIVTLVPLALLAMGAMKHPAAVGRFAVGAAFAIALCLTFSIAPLSLFLLFGALMGDVRTLVLGVVLIVVQIGYVRAVAKNGFAGSPAGFAGMLVVPLLAAAVYGGTRIADEGFENRRLTRWMDVRSRLYAMDLCVMKARNAAGNFPETLPSSCAISMNDVEGKVAYRLHGDSLHPAADFLIEIRISNAIPEARQLFLDTLGVFFHQERPPWLEVTMPDIVDDPRTTLRTLEKCLTVNPKPTPSAAIGLNQKDAKLPYECLGISWKYDPMTAEPDGSFTSTRGYRYSVRWIDQTARTFDLHARPLRYGASAIRSFTLASGDSIRSTAEDRAATRTDRTFRD